jgi:F-type H+-transporting ATPase subunit delta
MAGRLTTAPRRYAEAAFEIAKRDDTLDRWRDELFGAAELMTDERVSRIVDNPTLPFADRSRVIDDLLERRVQAPVRNLVRMLSERSRIELLPAIASEYDRLLKRERGIATAIVTSAARLTDDEREALEGRLRSMTGAQVELEEQIDESLIGGLTVRVGDRLYDGSVRGRLERLRDQLVAGVR